MRMQIKAEWRQLKESIDKLEVQVCSSNFPTPTPEMCTLLIAGEDRRFYYHPGVDPIALCRAVWKTVFCGSRQGASTIAMQLVRTITGRYEKTWQRKLLEIILSVGLTHYLSRDRLPILYLWIAYYGSGMNNFKQACSRLGIDPRSASALEAAKLVARLKYPEPQKCGAERARKICCRGLHLLTLTKRMSLDITGEPKNGTVQNCVNTGKSF
jgi:membrane carboxypeptidase/penicillin-binding protein PbpC